MKKILLMILAVTAALSFQGCGKEASAFEVYMQASEAMKKVDSISMNTNTKMSISVNEEKMDMTMSGTISEVIKSETEIDMELDMQTNVRGQNMPMKAYYKDGMYYVDAEGSKMKMEMPLDKMLAQTNSNLIEFPESSITNQSLKDVDGNKELTFTLDGSALKDVLDKQLSSLKNITGSLEDFNIGSINLKAVVDKDGNMKSCQLVFPLEMSANGQNMKMDCDIEMEIIQVGGVTINFPEDLDTYKEVPGLQ